MIIQLRYSGENSVAFSIVQNYHCISAGLQHNCLPGCLHVYLCQRTPILTFTLKLLCSVLSAWRVVCHHVLSSLCRRQSTTFDVVCHHFIIHSITSYQTLLIKLFNVSVCYQLHYVGIDNDGWSRVQDQHRLFD